MAATNSIATFGQIAVLADPTYIFVAINGNGATYATASGGLPIDLSSFLNMGTGASPFSQPYISPNDVVAFIATKASATGKYWATALAVGTPTYTTTGLYPFAPAGNTMSVQTPPQQLATCPASIRLYNGTTEFADGACSEVITGFIVVARGGPNPTTVS